MSRSNPAIKRIMADVKELQQHPSSRYHAEPTEDNMFEWHFTIRGPADSDFEGGIYHGRILLPPEYPFKPPNIVFMTKNGRFETGVKICLSISAYHPEHWQPAWGVRTMLEAIISFLPTEGQGAIGALDWTPRERKNLAAASLDFKCPLCGEVRSLLRDYDEKESIADPEMAAQISQLHVHGIASPSAKKDIDEDKKPSADVSAADSTETNSVGSEPHFPPTDSGKDNVVPYSISDTIDVSVAATTQPPSVSQDVGAVLLAPGAVAPRAAQAVARNPARAPAEPDYVDSILLLFLGALGVVICALVVYKTSHFFEGRDL